MKWILSPCTSISHEPRAKAWGITAPLAVARWGACERGQRGGVITLTIHSHLSIFSKKKTNYTFAWHFSNNYSTQHSKRNVYLTWLHWGVWMISRRCIKQPSDHVRMMVHIFNIGKDQKDKQNRMVLDWHYYHTQKTEQY